MLNANVCDWQYDLITAQERFISLMAGRRAGKSLALQLRMMNNSMYSPGYKTLYLSPNGALCDEIFNSMCSEKYIAKRIKKITKQPQRKILFRNGSEIVFQMFAGDPNKLRGMWFNEIHIDEIQSLESNNNKEAILSIVLPMLMDTNGTLIIAGQFRTKRCWWYKMWDENKNNPEYKQFQIPSWRGWLFRDGGINHHDIQSMRDILPSSVFDQEIACIPTANSNSAFKYEDLIRCVSDIEKPKPSKKNTYVIGVDLGRTVDPSAWCAINLQTATVEHSELRRIGERHETGAQKLAELAASYNNAEVFADTTGGATGGRREVDAFVKFYRDRLASMRAVNLHQKNKARLIQNLILDVEMHNIIIPKYNEILLEQMEQYEYKEDRFGGFSYSGPNGHNDDLVIALALALEGYKLGSYGAEKKA